METGLNAFKEALHLKHVEAGEYSPLALAYIGDAVYELAIRTLVMNRGNMPGQQDAQEDGEPGQGGRTGTFLFATGGRADGCGEDGIPTRTQCEIFYDAEARDDEGLPDGDRI